MEKYLLETLMAQIAIYTGKRAGGLSELQDWYNDNHLVGKLTKCEECGRVIEQGHTENCPIVFNYKFIWEKNQT